MCPSCMTCWGRGQQLQQHAVYMVAALLAAHHLLDRGWGPADDTAAAEGCCNSAVGSQTTSACAGDTPPPLPVCVPPHPFLGRPLSPPALPLSLPPGPFLLSAPALQGCPVVKGIKYTATKWVHAKPFRRERGTGVGAVLQQGLAAGTPYPCLSCCTATRPRIGCKVCAPSLPVHCLCI